MRYKANRGGHAPGHLRDGFQEYLEKLDEGSPPNKLIIGYWQRSVSLNWLLGQLWNCTDVMPGECCQILDMDPGSTYAQAVRKVKADSQL